MQRSIGTKPLCRNGGLGYNQRMIRHMLTGLFCVLIAGCTVMPVEEVPLATPYPVPHGTAPTPIGFNHIRYAVPTDSDTIGISTRSLRCPLMMRKTQAGVSGRSFPNDEYRRIFTNTLSGLGYDVTGDPGRLFDEQEDMARTVFAVGARITDINIDMCEEQSFFFGYDLGVVGEADVTVEWTVFDLLNRRNVFKGTTKGYSELSAPNDEGLALLLQDSFANAVHNLGAERDFFELVFFGTPPTDMPETVPNLENMPAPLFDPQERVALPQKPLLSGAAKARDMEDARRAAVLIRAGPQTGSGVLISPRGHILTNAHVVGNASRVRVTLANKKESVMAEVLRLARKRDVALLRLEEAPARAYPLLPIRLEKPAVSEEIYAVGAPLKPGLQDTVTKGIVSAHRFDRREQQWYIQGDVYTYHGNSGGPLLDRAGNLVGLSVAGYMPQDAGGSLNLFIPIADALDVLSIDFNGETLDSHPQDLLNTGE